MLQVAMIEDEQAAKERLESCLRRFAQESGEELAIHPFGEAVEFLDHYKPIYDVVFMDIELPHINGMDAARRLREMDQKVVLIFVTNMAQYAVKGYEVNALDYIIKPLNYGSFALKMERVVRQVKSRSAALTISQQNGIKRILLREIRYIEVQGHRLVFHTESGPIPGSGSLSEMEQRLKGRGFSRCNKCYLVNLRYVAQVEGLTLWLREGDGLQISRPRKKEFLSDFAEYLGNGDLHDGDL